MNSIIVGYKFCNAMYPFFSCTSARRDIPLLTHTYMRIRCGCFCWKCRFVSAFFLWACHVCLLVGLFLLWYLFLQCAALSHLNFRFGWYYVFINTAALLREFSIILSFVSKECLHFRILTMFQVNTVRCLLKSLKICLDQTAKVDKHSAMMESYSETEGTKLWWQEA